MGGWRFHQEQDEWYGRMLTGTKSKLNGCRTISDYFPVITDEELAGKDFFEVGQKRIEEFYQEYEDDPAPKNAILRLREEIYTENGVQMKEVELRREIFRATGKLATYHGFYFISPETCHVFMDQDGTVLRKMRYSGGTLTRDEYVIIPMLTEHRPNRMVVPDMRNHCIRSCWRSGEGENWRMSAEYNLDGTVYATGFWFDREGDRPYVENIIERWVK